MNLSLRYKENVLECDWIKDIIGKVLIIEFYENIWKCGN